MFGFPQARASSPPCASAPYQQRHPSQKTSGAAAARQAAVLLATNTDDLERAYDDWAERYDEDLRSLGGWTTAAGSSTASVLRRSYVLFSLAPSPFCCPLARLPEERGSAPHGCGSTPHSCLWARCACFSAQGCAATKHAAGVEVRSEAARALGNKSAKKSASDLEVQTEQASACACLV